MYSVLAKVFAVLLLFGFVVIVYEMLHISQTISLNQVRTDHQEIAATEMAVKLQLFYYIFLHSSVIIPHIDSLVAFNVI